MLRDLGVTSLDPAQNQNNRNGRGIGDTDLLAVCQAINGALGEIFNEGPACLSERPDGGVLRPETALTLTATQFEKEISSVATWADWMVGCTIRIEGDPLDNRILSSGRLAHPYMGETGSGKTAQVYGDCIPLAPEVSHLIEPVVIPGFIQLEMKATLAEFNVFSAASPVKTPRTVSSVTSSVRNKFTAQPCVGFVDTIYDPGLARLQRFLRVSPMPARSYPVDFMVKLAPPTVSPNDISAEGDTAVDPDVLLSLDQIESILAPIARLRLSSDGLFGCLEGREEIARQAKIAYRIIANMGPSRIRQRGIYK